MEMDLDRLAEGIPIERTLRNPVNTTVHYLLPPYTILLGLDIPARDIVATAVCRLLSKLPQEVIQHKPSLSAEDATRLAAVEKSSLSDQTIIFIGMAGLMTLAKEVKLTQPGANYDYLRLRWKALCAKARIMDILEQKKVSNDMYMGIMDTLTKWQAWIKSQTSLRRKLLDYVLENKDTHPLASRAISQVKMVLYEFGLRSAIIMERFITSGSEAIFLPPIAQQAVDFKRAITALKEKHKEKFPYARIYPLKGVDTLNYRLYPDLYYAAITAAIKRKELGGRYIIKEVQTTIPRYIINEHLHKTYKIQTMDETTRENRSFPKGNPRGLRRPRDEDEDEEEDIQPRKR